MLALRAAAPLIALVMACGEPLAGERANNGCPPDETCSPETPGGLYFGGRGLSDQFEVDEVLRPTVTGGRQTYGIHADEDFTPLLDFAAEVDTDACEVLSAGPGEAVLHGLRPGNAHLRIVDPDDGTLFDRTIIKVRDVANAHVVPSWLDVPLRDPSTAAHDSVYLADVAFSPVIALWDRDGERLIDEAMTYEVGKGLEVVAWDALFAPAGLPAGQHHLTATLGNGTNLELDFTVVERIDDLYAYPLPDGAPIDAPLAVGGDRTICFQPLAGARPVAARNLGVAVTATQRLDVAGTVFTCVSVRRSAAGLATLSVSIGGVSRTITVGLDGSGAAVAPPSARPRVGLVPGERAGHAAGQRSGAR